MKTKNNILMFLFVAAAFFSSCETFDLDQTQSDSTPNAQFLDPVYTFNYAQIQLPNFVNSANAFTQRVTRQMAMTGGSTYDNDFAPVNFDANWTQAYQILNAIKAMEPKAQQNQQNYILGASKVIRCYVLMTLVDMYGDIPYSEALMGNANLRPKFDASADVYAGVYDELNQAIVYLQDPNANGSSIAPRDLYYGDIEGNGNPSSWVTLAKTLKLKMLNNARLVGNIGTHNVTTEATALLAENDLIDTPAEDFAFKYGTNRTNPNSRHPLYNAQYENNGGPYIANYFMWAVSREKANAPNTASYFDPRTYFYFYRQITAASGDDQTLPCENQAKPDHYDDVQYRSFYVPAILAPYCTTDLNNDATAFWGRDHGDATGIPQDDKLRSMVGVYPAGGKILSPTESAGPVSEGGTEGALGQGIMPMVMSSFVHFIKAELVLTLGLPGDAGNSLEQGIEDSVVKVTTFSAPQTGQISQSIVDSKKATYKAFVRAKFDASSAADKLQIIIKEYYIAAWGNGIEPYNSYRRTGYPSNFQPTIELESGLYYSTALYPGASVNNNPNAPNNVRTKKTFWDVASITLH